MNKLDKTTKIQLFTYFIGGIGSVVLTVFAFLFGIPNSSSEITIKVGLLSINIVFLFSTLHVILVSFFNEQKKEIEISNKCIQDNLSQISAIIQLEDVHRKIGELEDSTIKDQYIETLGTSLKNLCKCIDEKRSGELEKIAYYGILETTASNIMEDKNNHGNNNYSGEIWALTFCLNKEWDDSDIYEYQWFNILENMDKKGIITRRLWVFNDSMIKLLKNPLDDDGKKLLNRLKMYCTSETKYKNTRSFAISEQTISAHDIDEFGKGFFAIWLSDKSSTLIYGVAKDRVRTSHELCGEIDYSDMRRNEIRRKWNSYVKIARSLNTFLYENSEEEVKKYMEGLNFLNENE
jgi:hypothetical protein